MICLVFSVERNVVVNLASVVGICDAAPALQLFLLVDVHGAWT